MSRRRIASLCILFGLILSFTTGITPAGADNPPAQAPAAGPQVGAIKLSTNTAQATSQFYGNCIAWTRQISAGYPSYAPIFMKCSYATVDDQYVAGATQNDMRLSVTNSPSFGLVNDYASHTDEGCPNYPGRLDVIDGVRGHVFAQRCTNWGGTGPSGINMPNFLSDPVGVHGFFFDHQYAGGNQHNSGQYMTNYGRSAGTFPVAVLWAGKLSSGQPDPGYPSETYQGFCTGYYDTENCDATGVPHLHQDPVQPPSPPVPQLACGRTMHDMGGGQWYAEVVAQVRNPPLEGSTYTDHGGNWRTSWDTGQFYGWRQTIPLPAGAKPGDGNKATYTMRRDYEVGAKWSIPSSQDDDLTESTDDYLTPDDVVGGPVVGGPILTAITMVGEWILGNGEDPGSGSITAVDSGGNPLPKVPTIATDVASVYARCSINIDPVAPEEEGVQQWITINITNNPDDPNPPADSDVPDRSETEECKGGSWWNPLTWAKSLFCKLRDILGFLKGFGIDKLPFLDGLEADWRGKFPLSVISDANGLATGLHDRIDSGVNGSPCSTIDPNMDGAISHPAAAELDSFRFTLPTPDRSCGESEQTAHAANLMGWRPPLRAFLGIFIYLAFFVRVITSFGPGRTGLEPDPEEAVK